MDGQSIELEAHADLLPLLPTNGWDEMNLAEIPFFVLTDRVAKRGETRIKHECTIFVNGKPVAQQWIINGSQEFGLPTAADARTYLALLRLTEDRNSFHEPRVEFTRLELIELLGLPNDGRSYQRIDQSLLRLRNLSFDFINSWWDQRQRKLTTCSFSLLSDMHLRDSRSGNGQGCLFRSEVVWSQTMFESLKSGFLRTIDYRQCIEFKNNTALQMYRFLGKRFYKKRLLVFPLDEFAYHRVGLAQSSKGKAQLVRKLQPGIRELEGIGFLQVATESERYVSRESHWYIVLAAGAKALSEGSPADGSASVLSAPAPSLHPLAQALNRHGVSPKVAAELVRDYPAERVEGKIDLLEWLQEQKPDRVNEPGAWLVHAIREDYSPPKGYRTKAEREAKKQAAAEARRKADEDRRRAADEKQREEAERVAIEDYWNRLAPDERSALETRALELADPTVLNSPLRQTYLKSVRNSYIHTLLFGSSST
jgi:hypothetical protein